MAPDLWNLYQQMYMSRAFEGAVTNMWREGKISGEMHLGTGEEAVAAGVVAHLKEGDALALDHRCTPPLLMRGVDPVKILRELLGYTDGLCKGRGGHMHLFSRRHLAASSGIVGASGPCAAGFALAARYLRPQGVAVAFFGEGAMNQGMLMESMNLAATWKLPVLFVCKDNDWAITTPSSSVTAGKLRLRAEGLGLAVDEVDGLDAEAVWDIALAAIDMIRKRNGPRFLHAACSHLEGHFLGDPLIEISRHPVSGLRPHAGPLVKSITRIRGATLGERLKSLGSIASLIGKTMQDKGKNNDPLIRLRQKLETDKTRIKKLENRIEAEIRQIVAAALREN